MVLNKERIYFFRSQNDECIFCIIICNEFVRNNIVINVLIWISHSLIINGTSDHVVALVKRESIRFLAVPNEFGAMINLGVVADFFQINLVNFRNGFFI